MTKLEQLEHAVKSLSTEDLTAFRKWFQSFDALLWDQQIERDAHEGKLDRFGDEALEDYKAGRTREL